jgi:hypothetical protein
MFADDSGNGLDCFLKIFGLDDTRDLRDEFRV